MPPVFLSALLNKPVLRPPRGLLPPAFGETYEWWVAGAAGLLLGLIMWHRSRRPFSPPAPILPPADLARQSLAALQNQPETVAQVAEVCRIIRGYAQATIHVATGELTTEELMAEVRACQGINEHAARALGEFLRECDAAKFAPAPFPLPAAIVSRAGQLIDHFESGCSPATEPAPAAAPRSSG